MAGSSVLWEGTYACHNITEINLIGDILLWDIFTMLFDVLQWYLFDQSSDAYLISKKVSWW